MPATSSAMPDLTIDRKAVKHLLVESVRRNRRHRLLWWCLHYAVSIALFGVFAAIGWWSCANRPPEFGRALPLFGIASSLLLAVVVAHGISFLVRRWLVTRQMRGPRLRDAIRRTAAIVRRARAAGTLARDPDSRLPSTILIVGGALFALASAAELGELLFGIPAALPLSSLALPTTLLCCFVFGELWAAYTAAYRPPDVLYLAAPRQDCFGAFIELSWTLYDPRVVTLANTGSIETPKPPFYIRPTIEADALRTADNNHRQWLIGELIALCGVIIVDTREATAPLLQVIEQLVVRDALKKTLFVVPRDTQTGLIEAAVREGALGPTTTIGVVRPDELLDVCFAAYASGRFRSDALAAYRQTVASVLAWHAPKTASSRRWTIAEVAPADRSHVP